MSKQVSDRKRDSLWRISVLLCMRACFIFGFTYTHVTFKLRLTVTVIYLYIHIHINRNFGKKILYKFSTQSLQQANFDGSTLYKANVVALDYAIFVVCSCSRLIIIRTVFGSWVSVFALYKDHIYHAIPTRRKLNQLYLIIQKTFIVNVRFQLYMFNSFFFTCIFDIIRWYLWYKFIPKAIFGYHKWREI